MNTYTRKTGKVTPNEIPAMEPQENEEEKIAVNGYEQVLAMLKVADPEFRESLLRRLAIKDKKLVLSLRSKLNS
jgi:hypothetical protein